MKFIIATHNKKKLAEMERILNPIGIEVSTAQLQEVDETGTTFAENAYLKANAACKETGLPAIADDSGLAVDSLNGAPESTLPDMQVNMRQTCRKWRNCCTN